MSVSPEKKLVAIAGGGTGGHLYPGLALAEKLKGYSTQNLDVIFIGSHHGLDSKVVPEFGYVLVQLSIGRGSPLSLKNPKNVILFLKGIWEGYTFFRKNKPDVVVSLGGFAAFIPGVMAWVFKIPLVLLEQNAIPGRVTKALSRFCRKIYLQFDCARNYFGASRSEIVYTGSPVLKKTQALLEVPYDDTRDALLIMGGSQGAYRLNQIICEIYGKLYGLGIKVIHIAGERDYDWVLKAAKGFDNISVLSYSDRIFDVYKTVKLAIARSGASTINEFQAAAIPAVFVPFPSARDDHQTANAEELVNAGAAVMCKESEIDLATFAEEIISLWNDSEKLDNMADNMRNSYKRDAAGEIAIRIKEIIESQ